MTNETWRPVEGFEQYEVSNTGKVRSHKRKEVAELKGVPHQPSGELYVMLRRDNKSHTSKIKSLVAKAFVDNPENHPCVIFKDGNVLNNHADNLEWVSMAQAVRITRRKNGHVAKPVKCSVEGCTEDSKARGYCSRHYQAIHKVAMYGMGDTPVYKREVVSYTGAHERVRRIKGLPEGHQCSNCRATAQEWGLSVEAKTIYRPDEGWYKDALFSLDVDDYQPMCKPCHRIYDARHRSKWAKRRMTATPMTPFVSRKNAETEERAQRIVQAVKDSGVSKASEQFDLSVSLISRTFKSQVGMNYRDWKKANGRAAA